MIMTLTFHFSSAHLYHQKKWSHEKNLEVFGRCYTDHGHGHNYRLEVDVDVSNNLPKLKPAAAVAIRAAINSVLQRLDHEHLNFTIPFFKDNIPTTENISLYLRDQIAIPAPYQMKLLRLFEMDTIFVELTV